MMAMSLLHFISERIEEAERVRTGKSSKTFTYGGFFFTVPIFFGIFICSLRGWPGVFGRVGVVDLWVGFVSGGLILLFGTIVWERRVPTRIHILASALAWSALVWLYFYLRL